MPPKKKFIQRMSFKYRVSILNENTLEEAFYVRLSRFSVFIYAGVFLLVAFVLLSLLIFFTPIKHFLPGFADSAVRSELISETMRLDSLTREINLQNTYVEVLKDILSGNIPIDSIRKDSLELTDWKSLSLDKSEREKEFVEEFEQDEKYNLSSIPLPKEEAVEVFIRPAKGVITQSFSPDLGNFGVKISTSPDEAVLSVLKGKVVLVDYSLKLGYTIVIQHNNGFLSIYKNNERAVKTIGDEVRAGEVIGIAGAAQNQTTESFLLFELWQKGKSINPSDYIIF